MRATSQDRDAAAMMGINVNRTISFTFALAGGLAGAGGLLYFIHFTSMRYDTGFQLGLIAFTAAVLGGIGNLTGAVLGAICIGLIEQFNEGLELYSPGATGRSMIFGILIAIVFRPEGLLGERTPEEHERERRARRMPVRRPGRRRDARLAARAGSPAPAAHGRRRPRVPLPDAPAVPRRHSGARRPAAERGDGRDHDRVHDDGVGLNVVVGYAGLLDLGYVAFYAAGAYTAAWFASVQFEQVTFHFGSVGVNRELPGIHMSVWLILILAGCFTGLVGIIIGLPTLRLRGDYLAIVTLGFGEIIPQFVRNADGLKGSTSRTARSGSRRSTRPDSARR